MSQKIYFLVYHSISDCKFVPGDIGICHDSLLFEKHISILARHFNVITHQHAVDILRGDLPPVKNAVVIHFDDGYRDNYFNAFPILKKYELPATVFLTTGLISTEKRLWLNEFYLEFYKSCVHQIDLEFMGNGKQILNMSTERDKLSALLGIRNIIKNANSEMRGIVVDEVVRQLRVQGSGFESDDLKMLTWEQVREMAEHNIDFGAHTVNHLILENETEETMRYEVTESKRVIEQNLGKEVTDFAYPGNNGRGFNDMTRKLIINSGYQSCCTFSTGNGFNNIGCDLFMIERNEVLGGAFELYCELLGLNSAVNATKCFIKQVLGRDSNIYFTQKEHIKRKK